MKSLLVAFTLFGSLTATADSAWEFKEICPTHIVCRLFNKPDRYRKHEAIRQVTYFCDGQQLGTTDGFDSKQVDFITKSIKVMSEKGFNEKRALAHPDQLAYFKACL